MDIMKINGYDAVIAYDEEIEMFRGEFVGLNGGADFYSTDIAGLHREGAISLQVFLSACQRARDRTGEELFRKVPRNPSA